MQALDTVTVTQLLYQTQLKFKLRRQLVCQTIILTLFSKLFVNNSKTACSSFKF